MKHAPVFAAVFAVTFLQASGGPPAVFAPEGFEILPQPKALSFMEAPGLSAGGLHTLVLGEGTPRPAVLPPLLDHLPTGTGTGQGVLLLALGGGSETPDHPEGYELTIADNSVRIASRGEVGLFYGMQTLQQLLQDARDRRIDIPALHITDWPADRLPGGPLRRQAPPRPDGVLLRRRGSPRGDEDQRGDLRAGGQAALPPPTRRRLPTTP